MAGRRNRSGGRQNSSQAWKDEAADLPGGSARSEVVPALPESMSLEGGPPKAPKPVQLAPQAPKELDGDELVPEKHEARTEASPPVDLTPLPLMHRPEPAKMTFGLDPRVKPLLQEASKELNRPMSEIVTYCLARIMKWDDILETIARKDLGRVRND